MDSHPETPQWTADRLASVAPAWEPDLVRARTRIRQGTSARPRPRLYVAASATAALVIAIVSPSGRALAQDLWYRLYASRIAVVRLDLSRNPLDTSIRTNGRSISVDSVEAAADAAGFTPDLPHVEGLPEPPVLQVLGPIEMTQTVRVPRLTSALAAAGVGDLEVPGAWDGVVLRADIGPIVAAKYRRGHAGRDHEDVEILQLPPVRLEMPAGFPLAQLAEVVFRASGASWWEARRLASEYADNPAWLFDLPAEAPVTVEAIALPRGNGVLVQYLDDDDPGSLRSLVLIGRPSRLYGITAPDREIALRIAAALP
jgi:hypothetical protein